MFKGDRRVRKRLRASYYAALTKYGNRDGVTGIDIGYRYKDGE